ncbi:hypothetical protein [Alkalimarinus coralli]|uniref:hypothetical protein n=1 Tax=Alkalimarinus coralli TaxID=2935863 RepID=UPI00202B188F|nr:hypothetical protein [Alkalimarinus coralli]
MKLIKLLLSVCTLIASCHVNALIIDYSAIGTVTTLDGAWELVGLSEGDRVTASWSFDTSLVQSYEILSTAPSSTSGRQAVTSFRTNGGISSFSLTTESSTIKNGASFSNELIIGENGAPPTDTRSINDSLLRIGDDGSEDAFYLLNLAGECCGKSILLDDLTTNDDPVSYFMSGFSFGGYGSFRYMSIDMSWTATYEHISASVRHATVPTPSPLILLCIGFLIMRVTFRKLK